MHARSLVFVVMLLAHSSTVLFAATAPTPIWARSPTGTQNATVTALAPDGKGGVLAAFTVYGGTHLDLGSGITVALPASTACVVLADFDARGLAAWGKCLGYGSNYMQVLSIVPDTAGGQWVLAVFTTGAWRDGTKVSLSARQSPNSLLLHLSAIGTITSARFVGDSPEPMQVNGMTADTAGNLYVVGYLNGTGRCDFGNAVFATGTYEGWNAFIASFDAAGRARWAQAAQWDGDGRFGRSHSTFNAATITADDLVVVAGVFDWGGFSLGNGVSVKGYSSTGGPVLAAFDTSGRAAWATAPSSDLRVIVGPWVGEDSSFSSVASDQYETIYAAGYARTGGGMWFGAQVLAEGRGSKEPQGLLVAYDRKGACLWAKMVGGNGSSIFDAVCPDPAGGVIAALRVGPPGSVELDADTTIQPTNARGGNSQNIALASFAPDGRVRWVRQVTGDQPFSKVNSVITAGASLIAAGTMESPGTYDFGDGIRVLLPATAIGRRAFVAALKTQ